MIIHKIKAQKGDQYRFTTAVKKIEQEYAKNTGLHAQIQLILMVSQNFIIIGSWKEYLWLSMPDFKLGSASDQAVETKLTLRTWLKASMGD